jgi:hypothetical protein
LVLDADQLALRGDELQRPVVRLHRHGGNLLAGESDADQPVRVAPVLQVGDGAIIVAGAIADAVARPVERGERRDDEVGRDRLLVGVRMAGAEDTVLKVALVVEEAEEHPLAHAGDGSDDGHGDPSPLGADPPDQATRIDLRAHRPE